ncbi:ComEA family DNA-binding protein [Synechocystis sp. LKSZ1]|uniref:ComEA family DNA-binding protein n=1 Tax=Synechocystis sp. LKSZ1 TaxID=3144951 RepID=UPI00336C2E6F
MFNLSRQALKRRLTSDPLYRFQSLAEVALAAELGVRIEANQATVDDWLRLPGLSIHQARNLVALVDAGMQFLCLEDVAAALSLPLPRLRPLAPILAFTYHDPDSSLAPALCNVNVATLEQLRAIPFIDQTLAELMISNRQQYGQFRHLADLQQRLGLETTLTSQLMYYLRF